MPDYFLDSLRTMLLAKLEQRGVPKPIEFSPEAEERHKVAAARAQREGRTADAVAEDLAPAYLAEYREQLEDARIAADAELAEYTTRNHEIFENPRDPRREAADRDFRMLQQARVGARAALEAFDRPRITRAERDAALAELKALQTDPARESERRAIAFDLGPEHAPAAARFQELCAVAAADVVDEEAQS